MQLLLVNATPAGYDISTQNAASARIDGFELEMVAQPIAGLKLSSAVGYMDSLVQDPPPGAGIPIGARLMEAPKWSVNLGGQYRIPTRSFGALTVRGDYSYRTKTFHDAKNTPAIAQRGYGLLNLRLAFETGDAKWEFAAIGTNVTDKRYKSTGIEALSFFNFAVAQWGRPREWGLSVQRRFGS